ncbi:MAG TPA: LLM class flavin-dependent oxidoreductase [Candidatus Dormibacteraeota bacterium]|nr:LLM class flavin-dependent oxidoreductase [Candidatus Dormibacteraeota bacterium]
MKFGVGMYSAQRPPDATRSFADLYGDMIRQAKLAEEVGLDSFWIAEHHFAEDGYAPSVLPVCAAVLASTQRLTAGTAVAIASFYNPIRLAEDAIALDLLSGGRFTLGIGTAYRREEFEGFGVAPETDEPRLDETVEILEKAFAGKPFSHRGKHYHVPNVTVTPPPFTEGGPPMILAGDGVIDRDAMRAAQRGKAYMIDPALPFDEVKRLVELYDGASTLDPKPELPLFNYGFISDEGDPWELMRSGFTYLRQTYDLWGGREVQEVHRENHRLILGTRDEVAAEILEYRRLFGDRLHFIMRLDYPGQDPEVSDAGVRAFGDVAKIVRLRLGQK